MVLIDTNILVFLLLQGEGTSQARELFHFDNDWRSDSFVLVEFSNVLATYLRERELMLGQATRLLATAEAVMQPRLIDVGHTKALESAVEYKVSAYDGRFLAAARQLDRPLITADAKLCSAAPRLTRSLEDALRELKPPRTK